MSFGERAWSTAGPSRIALAAVIVVCAALVAVVVDRSSATSTGPARSMPSVTVGTIPPPPPAPSGTFAPGPPDRLPREQQRGLAEADGVVPAGATVFDGAYPAVANLDAALLGALRQAAEDAARQGITFYVESGWRSPKYQEQLLRRAIAGVRLGSGGSALGCHGGHVGARVG